MNSIWSDNKYTEAAVNILLFLTGINFLHYGQLILPVICLLLFIDNRLRFKVSDPKVFVVLCLFAVSFYGFSKKDFYCVMGFTLPMAYYIGSNIRYPNQENVRKVIYLFAIAMGFHLFLDLMRDLILRGPEKVMHASTHYDIWTNDKISSTLISVELDLLIACFYYLLMHEKDRKVKAVSAFLFVSGMAYCLIMGRRAPILMFFLAVFFGFLADSKVSDRQRKAFFVLMGILIGVFLVLGLIYSFDLFGLKVLLDRFYIFEKISRGIMDSRLNIYREALKLLGVYCWGGQKISASIGIQIHELWLDVYDYAGIITYALLLCYTFFFIRGYARAIAFCKGSSFRSLLVSLLICIFIQMFLEPVMTAASLFLLIVIIIGTMLERMSDEG